MVVGDLCEKESVPMPSTRAAAKRALPDAAPAAADDDSSKSKLRDECLDLIGEIQQRSEGGASPPDGSGFLNKVRQTAGMLGKEQLSRTLADLKTIRMLMVGNDPTTRAPACFDKTSIVSAAHCWRSLRDAIVEAWGLEPDDALSLLQQWNTSTADVSTTAEFDDVTLPLDARALLRKLAEVAKERGGELRVLATGWLSDLLVQLKLKASALMPSRAPWKAHFEAGGAYEHVQHTPAANGLQCCIKMLAISSQGLNLRRVRVRERGAEVATFLLAVCGHAGGKKRGATEGDIEVPAQLLRDLFDGKTLAEDLTLDLNAL